MAIGDDFNGPGRPRSQPLVVPCVPEYEHWVWRHAQRARTSKSGLVDGALAYLAEARGWPSPPPRLNPGADPYQRLETDAPSRFIAESERPTGDRQQQRPGHPAPPLPSVRGVVRPARPAFPPKAPDQEGRDREIAINLRHLCPTGPPGPAGPGS